MALIIMKPNPLTVIEGGTGVKKVATLKNRAKESATFRGHTLTRFKRYTVGSRNQYYAVCSKSACSARVTVITLPYPNEIEVVGDAVALHCPVPHY